MVEKHIKNLLFNHDCVIIPEFGGLITRYVPASINPVKHMLVPPSKKIAFNEKLVLNDGLLISTIAYANNISKEEAKQMVVAFVHSARTRLNGENRFELADIGVFRYNAERRLEFEYKESENLLESSFGLPEIVARPIRAEEPAVLRTLLKERKAEPAPVKQPLRSRLRRAYNVAAGLALTGLVGAGLYMLSLQTDYTISSLSPTSLFGAERQAAEENASASVTTQMPADQFASAEESLEMEDNAVSLAEGSGLTETSIEATQYAADESVIAKADEQGAAVEVEQPSTTISGKDGRFYIITGGYARMHNAEFSRQEIAEKGHEAKVLEPGRGNRLFKVAVADFATAEEAQAAMDTYRQSFGETIWVYNN
ncbi:HU-CCDC81 and SPOR domain-containing protein [Pontibacter sp. JH31]|uniref:HU-CCDC81 and SPOR domain-containing protein n=1 Tax=Pontibacter aquaedesilientis TaxID=2766980 RepID=A0ABR7XCL0_9BACT|nr:SPOR domain-containing protein [Pontibacter aquaedesilientis]MBD1396034.1 HU-CCDC81 and SPOR domain-containing protein [Pontibacter aquaedesilientis]